MSRHALTGPAAGPRISPHLDSLIAYKGEPPMKRLGVLLSLPLLLCLLGAPVSAQPKEVVIGVIYPMSGANAQAGVDNKPVLELAADIANGAVDIPYPFYQRLKGMPGLKGAKVRLIFTDHQGKPRLGHAPDCTRAVWKDAEGPTPRGPVSTDLIAKRPIAQVVNDQYNKPPPGNKDL